MTRRPHDQLGPEVPADALLEYVRSVSRPEHPELTALRARTAGLPFVAVMQGSPALADLLRFLIAVIDARRVLEIGVFTGCSTLAMASALPPDGRIVAIDESEQWPAIGREYWARSGCDGRIDLRIGDAGRVLDALIESGAAASFDLAFVDANKDGYDAYYERLLVLLRAGGVMVFDNVLFGGRVHSSWTEARIREAYATGPRFLQDLQVRFTEGLRRFNDRIAADERVDLAVLPLLDGVTLARKREGRRESPRLSRNIDAQS